jgi:hypothetical protein
MDRSTTIASSGKFVFDEVSNVLFSIGAGRVTRWDATNGQFLSAIEIGANLAGIAISPDGRYLLVGAADLVPTTGGGSSVALFRIDLTTMARTTITTPPAFYEGGVADIVIDADGIALFTTHFQGSGWTPLRRFDVAAETPTMSNVTGGADVRGGTAMIRSPNGEFVLVLESNSSNAPFALYSASQDRIIASSDLYRIGRSGFNDGRGDVSNLGDIAIITYNTFVIYDRDLNLVRDFTSRQSAGSIADAQFSADGRFLFVLNVGSDVLEVIRVSDWSLTQSVPLGVDLHPTGNGSIYNGLDLIDDGGLLLLTTAAGVRVIDLDYVSVTLTGTPANDQLTGASANDTLNGAGGDDTLDGRSGDDILNGGAGNDVLIGGAGDDRIDGGSGHDIAIVSGVASSYRLLMNGDNFILKGPDGSDWLTNVESIRFSDGRILELNRMYGPDVDTRAWADGQIPEALLSGGAWDEERPLVLPGPAGDDVLIAKDGGGPEVLLAAGDGDGWVWRNDDAPLVLPGAEDVFVVSGKGFDGPEVLPGIDDWTFAGARGFDQPEVLPGLDERTLFTFDRVGLLDRSSGQMLTVDEQGLVVGHYARGGGGAGDGWSF